ncbi:universal stress protein [Amycolatopsis minnesotensis]|uniref:universal stress protein n=1 Tax=Amycolatopsis minnesotensis TaxID=337894 RepID=UPI0031DB1288
MVVADGSGSAGHAERWAADEATRWGARLRVTRDLAVPSLIEESREARLIVFAPGGEPVTALALVTDGHCPVAVVRGRKLEQAPPVEGPVVVGVDGTPASEPALALAFAEASSRGADLLAVHTWVQFSATSTDSYARDHLTSTADIAVEESELLAERLAGWQEKYPEVTVHRVVSRNRPVRFLLEQAEHARLLIVGSRAGAWFSDLSHGSTSQALLFGTPCPLIVVRAAITDEMRTR